MPVRLLPEPGATADVEVELCPDGPMLVRGPVTVVDEDGTVTRSTRPVSALCRCGASRRKPWCDATHKLLPDSTRGRTIPT